MTFGRSACPYLPPAPPIAANIFPVGIEDSQPSRTIPPAKTSREAKKGLSPKPPTVWEFPLPAIPHQLRQIVNGRRKLEALVKVCPSPECGSPRPSGIQNMREGSLKAHSPAPQQLLARLALGAPSGFAHHSGFFRGEFFQVPVPDRIGNHCPNPLLLQEPHQRGRQDRKGREGKPGELQRRDSDSTRRGKVANPPSRRGRLE